MTHLRFLLVLVCFGLMPVCIYTQTSGCTDPLASNYDPAAINNDGSCLYPPTSYSPSFITFLSDTVHESSGLAFFGGMLWTQNDSGNPQRLYAVDTLTGNIRRSVWIANAPNQDWESLAQSTSHLFIGDFGNNQGDRKNLRIFCIALDSLLALDTVTAEVIGFTYPDQSDFSSASNNNEYDCEAFYFWQDSLHLFTKNWVSNTTRYYTLPHIPGQFEAMLRDSFDTEGLITGAAIQSGGDVVLCGYKNMGSGFWTCFAWLLYDYPDYRPFGGNKRRIELGTALQLGQMEAVWFHDDGRGWLTGESISAGPFAFDARLSRFDFTEYVDPSGTGVEVNRETNIFSMHIYPNPARGVAIIELNPSDYLPNGCNLEVYDTLGRMVYRTIFPSDTSTLTLPTESMPGGKYTLSVVHGSHPLATGQLIVE